MKNWVSFSPHIKQNISANKLYIIGIISALPVAFYGIATFGLNVILLLLASTLSAVIADVLSVWIVYKKLEIKELSSVYVGLLIGLSMPPACPFWIPIIASILAVVLVKTLAGGVGKNFVSEVAAAKILVALMFGAMFYRFIDPQTGAGASETLVDNVIANNDFKVNFVDLLLGSYSGSIGETGILYVLIGGLILMFTKVIDYKQSLAYLLSVFAFSYLLFDINVAIVLTLSSTFVAFFVITDYATSPDSGLARLVYGLFLGVITALIFKFGEYRFAGYYATLLGGLVYSAIKGSFLPFKKVVKA